jgi:hypothetical protein
MLPSDAATGPSLSCKGVPTPESFGELRKVSGVLVLQVEIHTHLKVHDLVRLGKDNIRYQLNLLGMTVLLCSLNMYLLGLLSQGQPE